MKIMQELRQESKQESGRESKQYSYYAFISYSRKDEKWAKWLQNRLESYRLPAAVRKQHLDIPRRIFPVFRDKTDLAGGVLQHQLHQEMDSSKFLIVICSPNSADSDWVNREVSYFIETGREEQIIPFIVDGAPDEEKKQCFPPALRKDVHEEILGISVKELGKTPAFLRVVATLLSIKYDQLVMRHRKRMLQQRIFAAVAISLLAGLLGAGIWYNMPHSTYYSDYVYRYEIPEGIHEISAKERKTAFSCYKIVTQRGKVIRLECVNSAGIPIDPHLTSQLDEYPVVEFTYNDGGQLSKALLKDIYGQIVVQKGYSYHLSENQIAVDYQQPNNSSQAFTMSADTMLSYDSSDAIGTNRSEITRLLNTYDENGYLLVSLYQQDNRNRPACDANGIYGKQYVRNDTGQVLQVVNLDETGKPHASQYGIVSERFAYDEKGHVILYTYYDEQDKLIRTDKGYAQFQLTYNEDGNIVKGAYLDEEGFPCNISYGYATLEISHDEHGFWTSTRIYDANGMPAYEEESGIFEFRYENDRWGRRIKISYFDESEQIVYCKQGYAMVEETFDEQGRVVLELYKDTEGNPAKEIGSGACGVRITYDENGYQQSYSYLNEEGMPFFSRYGYAFYRYENDGSGNITKIEFYDASGELVRRQDNAAIFEYCYDSTGNLVSQSFYDENGIACMHAEGYGRIEYSYANGKIISEKYFDTEGSPVVFADGYHECRMEYDEKGNCIKMAFYDENGELTLLPSNYAILEMQYDQYANVVEQCYYGTEGEPSEFEGRYQTRVSAYDKRGNRIMDTYYPIDDDYKLPYLRSVQEYDLNNNKTKTSYLDGNDLACADENGVSAYIYQYDEKSQLIREEYRNAEGGPQPYDGSTAIEYDYDEMGNVTRLLYFTAAENGAEECWQQVTYGYDEYNNRTLIEYRDKDGNLTCNSNGYAFCQQRYNATGDMTERSYYNEYGAPVLAFGQYFRYVILYDAIGNQIEYQVYDTDDQPLDRAGLATYIKMEYNLQRKEIVREYFDKDGNPVGVGSNGAFRKETIYDNMGNVEYVLYYDIWGYLLNDFGSITVVFDVAEGSLAEENGLRAGDIILYHNGYCVDYDYNQYPELEVFDREIQTYAEDKNIYVIAREGKDQRYEFWGVMSGQDDIGVDVTKKKVNHPKEVELLIEQWKEWILKMLYN